MGEESVEENFTTQERLLLLQDHLHELFELIDSPMTTVEEKNELTKHIFQDLTQEVAYFSKQISHISIADMLLFQMIMNEVTEFFAQRAA